MKKTCSVLLGLLVLVMALTGCGQNAAPETTVATVAVQADGSVLGEGATVFTLEVTDLEGKTSTFEIHTDKTSVGEALQEVGLVDGEMGEYGLFITTVNGQSLDWDKDGKYWAFYVGGEYAVTSADTTPIEAGVVYSLKAE